MKYVWAVVFLVSLTVTAQDDLGEITQEKAVRPTAQIRKPVEVTVVCPSSQLNITFSYNPGHGLIDFQPVLTDSSVSYVLEPYWPEDGVARKHIRPDFDFLDRSWIFLEFWYLGEKAVYRLSREDDCWGIDTIRDSPFILVTSVESEHGE